MRRYMALDNRHPPGMVVCDRTGDLAGPSFLALNTAPKEEFHKLKKLLGVAAREKVLVLRKKAMIDKGYQSISSSFGF